MHLNERDLMHVLEVWPPNFRQRIFFFLGSCIYLDVLVGLEAVTVANHVFGRETVSKACGEDFEHRGTRSIMGCSGLIGPFLGASTF